jgi:hypothetical protein
LAIKKLLIYMPIVVSIFADGGSKLKTPAYLIFKNGNCGPGQKFPGPLFQAAMPDLPDFSRVPKETPTLRNL